LLPYDFGKEAQEGKVGTIGTRLRWIGTSQWDEPWDDWDEVGTDWDEAGGGRAGGSPGSP